MAASTSSAASRRLATRPSRMLRSTLNTPFVKDANGHMATGATRLSADVTTTTGEGTDLSNEIRVRMMRKDYLHSGIASVELELASDLGGILVHDGDIEY